MVRCPPYLDDVTPHDSGNRPFSANDGFRDAFLVFVQLLGLLGWVFRRILRPNLTA